MLKVLFARIPLLLLVLLVMAGCGGVSSEKAAADYARLNPGHTVLSARPSEVDVIGYTFDITFQAAGDPQIRATEFGYIKTRSGEWVPRDAMSTVDRSTTAPRRRRGVRGPGGMHGVPPGTTTSLLGGTTSPLRLFFR